MFTLLHDYSKQRKFQNVLRMLEVSVLYYLKYRIKRPEVFSLIISCIFHSLKTNKYLHRVIMQPRKLFKPLVLARAISFTNCSFRKNKWLRWSTWKLSDRRNIGWWLTTLRWWRFNWIWWQKYVILRLTIFLVYHHRCFSKTLNLFF